MVAMVVESTYVAWKPTFGDFIIAVTGNNIIGWISRGLPGASANTEVFLLDFAEVQADLDLWQSQRFVIEGLSHKTGFIYFQLYIYLISNIYAWGFFRARNWLNNFKIHFKFHYILRIYNNRKQNWFCLFVYIIHDPK